ncbi:MAG: hypothetical protein KIS67_19660 [Verrucomicrobiae bacterium]|nr:hypothetical protein [Verrucomicrobiae bacterium]
MPQIRRSNLPPALLQQLLERIRDRKISAEQLVRLADWLATCPEVPAARWFKRFPEMTVCGEAGMITTFLRLGQVPEGKEVQ